MDNFIQNFIHIPKLKFWGVIIVKIIFGNSYIVETLQDTWRNITQVFGKTLEDEDGRYLDIALSIILGQCLICNSVFLEHV